MSSRQNGLSLIELMIGLVIFGIIIMAGMPSYTAWLHNSKIRTAAESISNGLQLARAEAVRRNTNVEFVLTSTATNASDWTVRVANPVAVIQSRAAGQGSQGVTMVVTPGTTRVTFNSLGRIGVNADGSAPFTRVDLDVPTTVIPAAASRELRVTLSPGGNIRMCDPSVSDATDTRYCV